MTHNEEVIYDGWINVYVPIWFDADKAFGLDLNSEENADWINMYIDWHPDDTIRTYISYYNNSTDDPDFNLEIIMSPHHRELFNAYFKEQFKAVYHMSVEEAWAKFGTE